MNQMGLYTTVVGFNYQYYEEETPVYQLQDSSPDPDYYGSSTRRSQKPPCDPNSYYPPPPNPADVQHWYVQGRGKRALLHGHRLFGEKTRSAESKKSQKEMAKLQTMNEEIEFLTFLF